MTFEHEFSIWRDVDGDCFSFVKQPLILQEAGEHIASSIPSGRAAIVAIVEEQGEVPRATASSNFLPNFSA
jgi:hypothetical protein